MIKPLLKKSTLEPKVIANHRPISNLPFLSEILEKDVANELCEFLQETNVVEKYTDQMSHCCDTVYLTECNTYLLASHGYNLDKQGRISTPLSFFIFLMHHIL